MREGSLKSCFLKFEPVEESLKGLCETLEEARQSLEITPYDAPYLLSGFKAGMYPS